jgi:hypothetical protein
MTEHRPNEREPGDSHDLFKQDRAGYDPARESFYAEYDEETTTDLGSLVVRSVAAGTGKAPVD